MKHEEFNLRYNEVMFEERDVIMNFLDTIADLSYGNQMFEYTLEPMPRLIGIDGNVHKVREIARDKEKFVIFRTYSDGDNNLMKERECTAFAYGELSKIIDLLPEPKEFALDDINDDFKGIYRDYNITALLQEYPFSWKDNKSEFDVHSLSVDNEGKINFEIHEIIDGRDGGYGMWENLGYENERDLRDHLKVAILKSSYQYKKLVGYLSKIDGYCYNTVEHGCATTYYITPSGTDLQLNILDVSIEHGSLEILVGVTDTALADVYGDTMNLHEKDIEPSYLDDILQCFMDYDIMDVYNGHDKELVDKINKIWKNPKYNRKLGTILVALLTRDKQEFEDRYDCDAQLTEEFAMTNAHQIIEGVCDDWDLETIISFVRYEED